ncbi:MAG: TolC family protein [Chitinophagaceae bacterium]|nr:TolC family protein [Chitinophagaceae bacterium]
MNERLIIVTLFLSLICARLPAQNSWNLKKSVEYALANNISVKQADIQARIAELNLKQSKLMQIPTASISGSAGINAGRSIDPTTNLFTNTQLFSTGFSLSSGVTIFNFFSVKNNIEGNKLDNEASRANVEKVRNDIALNVATAYLLVLVSKEQENIANLAVQLTLQNLDNTRKRVEAGVLPELNLAEIEAQLALDSSNLITAINTVKQNILQLKAILNVDAGQTFVVETPPLEKIPILPLNELQPEYVYSQAVMNLPQQRVNDLRIKAAEKYVLSARGQMYPTISLFAGLGTNYANNKIPNVVQVPTGNLDTTGAKVNVNGTLYDVVAPGFNSIITTNTTKFGTQLSDNFRQNIGVQLTIPLFNNGVARTNWQKSKLNVTSLQLQRDLDLVNLKQDIYTAYNDASTAIQKYQAGIKRVQTAEKAYNFAQKRYDVGLLPTLDLLTNQNNLNRARVELAQAQVDYVFKLKVLEFYKGQGITVE